MQHGHYKLDLRSSWDGNDQILPFAPLLKHPDPYHSIFQMHWDIGSVPSLYNPRWNTWYASCKNLHKVFVIVMQFRYDNNPPGTYLMDICRNSPVTSMSYHDLLLIALQLLWWLMKIYMSLRGHYWRITGHVSAGNKDLKNYSCIMQLKCTGTLWPGWSTCAQSIRSLQCRWSGFQVQVVDSGRVTLFNCIYINFLAKISPTMI